ncbi:MAG: bacteriohopanetetrol glucosamine biosynthesis glycosyltransferase HpnI [Steroidobacteraceae bacterium]|jgi:ceramide glucosyltransferase
MTFLASIPAVHAAIAIVGWILLAAAAGHSVLSVVAVLAWIGVRAEAPRGPPTPVTVLQPLCGLEPRLYENLRSLCRQVHPQFQIVYGVREANDPALAVVARLAAEFPSLKIDVVVDPLLHGANLKISNMINMIARARYDVLVMVDSDVWVDSDYLTHVTAPLQHADVGLVTCLYRDVPTMRVWSRLGAMYVNEWYMPSVMLAHLFGFRGYASGQTLCIRRETLEAIGGLGAIVNYVADDYRLGQLVRALGQRIVLYPYRVNAEHDEPDAGSLIRHELRWMRTIHVLQPAGFRMLFITFTLPLAAIGLVMVSASPPIPSIAWALFWITAAARLFLHAWHRLGSIRGLLADWWLVPVRDLLLCCVWCSCFFASRLSWRGSRFSVDADGIMYRLP